MTQKFQPQPRTGNLRRVLLIAGGILLIVVLWVGYNAYRSQDDTTTTEAALTPTGELQVNVQDGEVFSEPVLTLNGSGPPDQLIFINSQPVPLDETGVFELTLQLVEGPNLILVEARDADGQVTSLARQVVYTPPEQFQLDPGAGATPAPGAAPAADPESYTGLLVLALGAIGLAVVIVLLRRRRPWVNLTTDSEVLVRGVGNETLTIILELDRTTRISIFVLDTGGKPIATLLNNRRRQGKRHTFTWNGRVEGDPVPGGAYSVQVVAGSFPARAKAEVAFEIREAGRPSLSSARR